MANKNNEVIGLEELSIYDALIKHYINLNYPKTNSNQIDDLFPIEPDPQDPGGNEDPLIPDPDDPQTPDPDSTINFMTATDEQIINMINGYYNGTYTLEQIKENWEVGDFRTIHLSAMEAANIGEGHAEQDALMVILDFDHDELTTPINGKTKSLLTVQLLTALIDTSQEEGSRVENGYMNSTDTNIGGWEGSQRRAWCNSIFYNALPSNIRNMVKEVNKVTNGGGDHFPVITTVDKVFLLSELEVFGAINYSMVDGGAPYFYFNSDNRKKFTNGNLNYDGWWERSSVLPEYTEYPSNAFCLVNRRGEASTALANTNHAISPAWCL